MRRRVRSRAPAVTLTAVLLVSSVLIALSTSSGVAPPSRTQAGLGGKAPPSHLLVEVVERDSSGFNSPLASVLVRVELAQTNLHFDAMTNVTGMAYLSLVPGDYPVFVEDRKFNVNTTVTIGLKTVTELLVTVGRELYPSSYSDLIDSDSSGSVDPWETIVLAVTPNPINQTLQVGDGSTSYPSRATQTGASQVFGRTVFVDLTSEPICTRFSCSSIQAEVQARVLSQSLRNGMVWLDLQPLHSLWVAGAEGCTVVKYIPMYQVIQIRG